MKGYCLLGQSSGPFKVFSLPARAFETASDHCAMATVSLSIDDSAHHLHKILLIQCL
jgi:hypothetical protein